MAQLKLTSILLILQVAATLSFTGCGANQPATIPVRGKVTFVGGQWPKGGEMLFLPTKAAAGFPIRPGKGAFDVDGQFTVGTFTKSDGLMPGSYRVGIECWKVPPTMGGPPPVSYLPDAYQSPMWTLEIEPESKALDLSYDVPSPN